MEIVEQTSNRLQLKSIGIQWNLLISLIGLLLVIAGLFNIILNFGGLGGLIMSVGLVLAGSVTIITAFVLIELWVVYTFDKKLGIFTLNRQTVFRKKVSECRLQEICSIQIGEEEDSDGTIHYVINIVLKSGRRIQMRGITQNPDKQETEQIAECIRRFL